MFLKPIFIVSGEKESGKTTFIINVLSLLQQKGFVVGGFVALHNIELDAYQIKDVKTHEELPLMQRVASYEQRPHHFKFFKEGIEKGNRCMNKLLVYPPDIAIVDEIGGYELRGELWSSCFTQLVESSTPLIFSVKDRLLNKVLAKWELEPSYIFESTDFKEPSRASRLIERLLKE